MNEQQERFYEFDSFLLDVRERQLLQEGDPLDLTPKVFDILLELVRESGRVVEKKELMERVWPDQFVEESNLTQHISTLRKKLAQSDKRRFIMTVPGRGYRFIPSVREWDDEAVMSVHERTRTRVLVEEAAGGGDELGLASGDEEMALPAANEPQVEIVRADASHAVSTRVWTSPKRRRAFIPATLIALALVSAFGIYKLFIQARVAPFEKTKLVKFTTTGKASCAAISPDGKYIAYGVNDAGQGSIWVRQTIMSSDGVQVVPTGESYYLGLTFSPDSNYLYYLRSNLNSPTLLYRVGALGGAQAKLAEDVDSPPAFSPDGSQMAYLRGYPDRQETSLMIANPDGTGERKLASLKAPRESFVLLTGPSWSPDGKRIACPVSKTDDAGEYEELYEVEIESGSIKPITSKRWQEVGRAAWLADGSGLLLVAADQESSLLQIWQVAYPGGGARKVTNDLSDYSDLSMSADGKALAVVQSDQQANIWLVSEADASRAVQITNSNYDGIQGLSWTPDGRIIYSTLTGAAENLRVTDAEGRGQRLLTERAGFNRSATVSPDGSTIAFALTHNGEQHLWLMEADGGNPRQLTAGVRDGYPVFSADGQWVIYKSYPQGNPNLFKISVGGGQPIRLTEKISGAPSISPDGRLIAFVYKDGALATSKVAVISTDGGPPLKLLDVNPLPFRGLLRWTRDGQSLAYINTRGGVSNIWLQPVEGGRPIQLTDFKQERIFWFDFSADGRTLAVARGHVSKDVVVVNSVE